MGPTIHVPSPWQINGPHRPQYHPLPTWSHSPFQPNLFGLPHNPFPPIRDPCSSTHVPVGNAGISSGDDPRRLGFFVEGNNNNNNVVDALLQKQKQQELKIKFGTLPIDGFAHVPQLSSDGDSLRHLKFSNVSCSGGYGRDLHVENPKPNPDFSNHGAVERERIGVEVGRGNSGVHGVGNFRSESSRRKDQWGSGTRRKGSEVNSGELGVRSENVHTMKKNVRRGGHVVRQMRLPDQLDHPGPPSGSNLLLVSASDIEESRSKFKSNVVEDVVRYKFKGDGKLKMEDVADSGRGSGDDDDEVDVLGEQLGDSLLLGDSEDKKNSRQRRRDKVNT